MEILIHTVSFRYALLEGRPQVTHTDKSGEKGFPPSSLHCKNVKQKFHTRLQHSTLEISYNICKS